MTKKEFIQRLFEVGLFKSKLEAERKVNVIFKEMENVLLSEDSLQITNFGKIRVVERGPRIGRNPKTGVEVEIKRRNSVKFEPSKSLLNKLNVKFK